MRRVWIHWRRESGRASLLAGGKLVHLNRVAAAVWEEIEKVPNRDALVRRMRRRFRGVEDAALRRDLDALLDRWLREDWLERFDDPVFPFPAERWDGWNAKGDSTPS